MSVRVRINFAGIRLSASLQIFGTHIKFCPENLRKEIYWKTQMQMDEKY
jgi:hypothetical protein